MTSAIVGILGGSGLYQMDALENPLQHSLQTPFGTPSDVLVTGMVKGVPVVFLARHGRGHRLIPSEVPYCANLYAFKQFGVKYVLSVSAVGSLREDIKPLDMVLPDQMIDMTKRRESTFFGQGAVAHVSMAQAICPASSQAVARAVRQVLQSDASAQADGVQLHTRGTYVCIEGPQFSSVAESQWYRSMGADIIGMTNMPEAKLAMEAQMAYTTLAMVTDFDCWHTKQDQVNANMALANLLKNAGRAQQIVVEAIRVLGIEQPASPSHSALQNALVTQPDAMSPEVRARLAVLLS
jgi:5'-methylthioadenosine phosphorylase